MFALSTKKGGLISLINRDNLVVLVSVYLFSYLGFFSLQGRNAPVDAPEEPPVDKKKKNSAVEAFSKKLKYKPKKGYSKTDTDSDFFCLLLTC